MLTGKFPSLKLWKNVLRTHLMKEINCNSLFSLYGSNPYSCTNLACQQT